MRLTIVFKISSLQGAAYLAIEGYEHLLMQELQGSSYRRYGNLFVVGKPPQQPLYWYANGWQQLSLIEFSSISTAAKALKSLQRNWWLYPWQHFRRAALIQEALPYISGAPIVFGSKLPDAPLGSWTLLSDTQILAAPRCSSNRPNGSWEFVEDREGPPSRAYLKLWEVFCRTGKMPSCLDRCLDLGASPGGWTWVLRNFGATVIAYDRSPLREDLMADPKVTLVKGDAFAVRQEHLDQASWLFCDVICYPEKLYEFIRQRVLPSGISHAVCTIKLQGDGDQRGVIAKFAEIPGSTVVHLSANKHELTWYFESPGL